MSEKVLIAGGTGAIGGYLIDYLTKKGFEVAVLSRSKTKRSDIKNYQWDVEKGYIDPECFRGVSHIIQLSGANISQKRWTASRRKEIVDSRVNSTHLLLRSVLTNAVSLKSFVSASAIGYYGATTSEHIFTESDSSGIDFLAETCTLWENAAMNFAQSGIRTVCIRTGIVLMKNEGAFPKLYSPLKMGLGIILGNGNQYFPWIHIDDLCQIYYQAIVDEQFRGAFNAVAPSHSTQKELIRVMRKSAHRRAILIPAPSFVLKLLLGKMAISILYGSRIAANKILAKGYTYKYDRLDKALENLTAS